MVNLLLGHTLIILSEEVLNLHVLLMRPLLQLFMGSENKSASEMEMEVPRFPYSAGFRFFLSLGWHGSPLAWQRRHLRSPCTNSHLTFPLNQSCERDVREGLNIPLPIYNQRMHQTLKSDEYDFESWSRYERANLHLLSGGSATGGTTQCM